MGRTKNLPLDNPIVLNFNVTNPLPINLVCIQY
jgi:hypothetical protein